MVIQSIASHFAAPVSHNKKQCSCLQKKGHSNEQTIADFSGFIAFTVNFQSIVAEK